MFFRISPVFRVLSCPYAISRGADRSQAHPVLCIFVVSRYHDGDLIPTLVVRPRCVFTRRRQKGARAPSAPRCIRDAGANACRRECTCKCRAAVRLSRCNVRRVARAAGVSRPGRVFMAEKIFYHNNTEIRRAGRPSPPSFFLSPSSFQSLSLLLAKVPVQMSSRGPCTYIKRGPFLFSLLFASSLPPSLSPLCPPVVAAR